MYPTNLALSTGMLMCVYDYMQRGVCLIATRSSMDESIKPCTNQKNIICCGSCQIQNGREQPHQACCLSVVAPEEMSF